MLSSERNRRVRLLSGAALAAQAIFVAGWLVAGAMEGHGYSVSRDDISDLAALTAHVPVVMLVAQGVTGVLTIAFALFALRPALRVPGHREPLSAWFLAGSLISLDNLSDAFFRLDCRAADAGCTAALSAASWHGKIHYGVGIFAALMTLIAPFALARRFRLVDAWRDWATPAIAYGIVVGGLLVAYGALERKEGGGYVQRAAALLVAAGVAALAARTMRSAAD